MEQNDNAPEEKRDVPDLSGCDCDYDPDIDGPVWERIIREKLYTYTDEEVERLDQMMDGTEQ